MSNSTIQTTPSPKSVSKMNLQELEDYIENNWETITLLHLSKPKLFKDTDGQLPESFKKLVNLKYFYTSGYNGLKSLPEWFSSLENVEGVELGFVNFDKFPEVLCSMTQLKKLRIDGSTNLSIPDSIGNLVNLEEFAIGDFPVASISSELSKCTNLTYIEFILKDGQEFPNYLHLFTKLRSIMIM